MATCGYQRLGNLQPYWRKAVQMKLYDGRTKEDWMRELEAQENWVRRHALCAFGLLDVPESLLDVGCGLGTAVSTALALGVEAYGIDQLIDYKSKYFEHVNLVKRFTLPKQVGMVWCTEVAEHLDPSAHATLCDTCADNLKEGRGNYLVFSSAFPNQGGSGHVSERPSAYWQKEFHLRELNFRRDLTVNLSMLWLNIGSPLYWLAANVMVFEK